MVISLKLVLSVSHQRTIEVGSFSSQLSLARHRFCINSLATRVIGDNYTAGSNSHATSAGTRHLVYGCVSLREGGANLDSSAAGPSEAASSWGVVGRPVSLE